MDINSELPLLTSHDLLESALVCQHVSDDTEASEWMKILTMTHTQHIEFEPLDGTFDYYSEHLKYAYLGEVKLCQ